MGKLTQSKLRKMFADHEAAGEWIAEYRWGSGQQDFICPRCGQAALPGSSPRLRYRCRSCFTLSSPLTGSVLGKTKIASSDVLWIAWQLASNPGGLSAVTAERESGISRRTTQKVLGVLRHALSEDERGRVLSGVIEADETFLGGKARDTEQRGRSPIKKCILVLAQDGDNNPCVLYYVPNAQAKTLLPLIKSTVEKGATIRTDGHAAYNQLERLGYEHQACVIKGSGIKAHVSLPGVHQVAKSLKSQIYGTHKRTPKDELIQDYLGAFQWRYNRRHLAPMDAFMEIMDVILKKDRPDA